MKLQDKRIVIGMDLDSAEEAISPSFVRRIENCRVNIVNGGNDGVVQPVMGNTVIVNPFLPLTGTNVTIGCYSDTTNNKVYYFNWNSTGINSIYSFDGTVFLLILQGNLGWTATQDIHSICLINNLLTWTEGTQIYPRQVDINQQYINPIEFDISYIKTPPTFPLQIQVQNSTATIQNFYKKNNYYFIYRFGYENGQQSTWSPYSKLCSSAYDNFLQTDYTSAQFKINELRVFREGGIDGLYYQNHIKYIDFAYANTYLGPFKMFKRVQVLGVTTKSGWDNLILSDTDLTPYGQNEDLSVQFRNDLDFSVIAATDTTRPYDEIWPCETITAIESLNIIGNTLEGLPGFNFQIGNVSQGFKSFSYFTQPLQPTISTTLAANMVFEAAIYEAQQFIGNGLTNAQYQQFQLDAYNAQTAASALTTINAAAAYMVNYIANILPSIATTTLFSGINVVLPVNQNAINNINSSATNAAQTVGGYNYFMTGPALSDSLGNFMVWKNYSTYGIGVVFYNEFGQKSGVYTNQQLRITTPADYRQASIDSVWALDFTIVGSPHPNATHYQLVRTQNNKTVLFCQGITNDVVYVSGYDSNGDPTPIVKSIGYAPTGQIAVKINSFEPDLLLLPGIAPGVATATNVIGAVTTQLPQGYDYTSPAQIYQGGLDQSGQAVFTKDIWYNYSNYPNSIGTPITTGTIGHQLIKSTYLPQYTTQPWSGVSSSTPFGGNTELKSIIGFTTPNTSYGDLFNGTLVGGINQSVLATAIYIGGVNRQGQIINQFATTGLNKAVDILIDIYNWDNTTQFQDNQNSTQAVINTYNPSCETPYVFQAGDCLNIYYSSTGNYVGILDLQITDFLKGRYLKVKFDQRLLDGLIVGAGAFIEIYTPNTSTNSIEFYEYGDCYPIMNPKTPQAAYSKTTFSIFEGDTHYMTFAPIYATNFRINYRTAANNQYTIGAGYINYPFFSMNPSSRNRRDVWEKANGRPNIVLLDGEQSTVKKSTLRYSDSYINGSTVNGTSTYYSFNQLQLDYQWGAIRKLTPMENLMLVNCEQEAGKVYVNKAMLSNVDGSTSLIISENLLQTPTKLAGGYGCTNPESVNKYSEYIYFWSKPKGCVLRFNEFNGLVDIGLTYNARSYFLNKVSNKCQSGFDPLYRTQYFIFDDENIGFIDPKSEDHPNTWGSFFSFLPEKMGYIQLQVYSFKNGQIWEHETGAVNNFYGVQYPSKIQAIFNYQPNYQKIFNCISLESDQPLMCESITDQEGQTTFINKFEKLNKDWQADIPGDTSRGKSRWEGDLMSSHCLTVNFRYDPASMFRLRYMNVYSQINMRTNEPNPVSKS